MSLSKEFGCCKSGDTQWPFSKVLSKTVSIVNLETAKRQHTHKKNNEQKNVGTVIAKKKKKSVHPLTINRINMQMILLVFL